MKIVYGDITEIEAEAIVNAANTTLKHRGSVALAILKAGGKEIQRESDKIGYCPMGKAVATSAGSLPYKCIIHVPTIDWEKGKRTTLKEIFDGSVAALKIAQEKQVRTIAFPLLGAGVVGLDKNEVKKQIEKAAKLFPKLEVILCLKSV